MILCHSSKWMKNLAFIVLLLPVVVYSQTIRKLDLPAGATDLIDPPQKRFQHLIEEGNMTTRNIFRHRDRTELNIDYSFSGEVISAEVDIEGVRIEQAYVNYSLGNGLTIAGGRILQIDESLQDAEEFFKGEGPKLEEYNNNLMIEELLELENPVEPRIDKGHSWLGDYIEVTEPPPLSPFNW